MSIFQGVEYADAHTRSEERLRDSEADCAALWEEREGAKERLCAAFNEGRALEEKLDESVAAAFELRQKLEETEARGVVAVKEAEVARNELGASRCEVSDMKAELEAMTDRCVVCEHIIETRKVHVRLMVVEWYCKASLFFGTVSASFSFGRNGTRWCGLSGNGSSFVSLRKAVGRSTVNRCISSVDLPCG